MTVFDINSLKSFLRGNYARNLVFKTDSMEIILVCWLPGQGAPLHDHGESEALTFILEGEMEYTTYYEDDKPVCGVSKAGSLEYIPRGVKHKVHNSSDKKLVTLHVYSPPLPKQQYNVTLGYANEANIQRLTFEHDSSGCLIARPPQKPKNIAIIGGGFSGTLVATQLMKNFQEDQHNNIQIIMIERASRFSRGFAYSTNSPQHLLNVPASGMSAFPDEPDHFFNWAQQRDPSLQKNSFVPRMLYGEYLESVLADAERNKSSNISFTRINGEANSIDINEDGEATVFLSNGIQFNASQVVLAVGNYPPKNVKTKQTNFYNSHLYQRDPWSSQAYKSFSSKTPVMLIGTGLTMMDKAIELKEKGLTAPIYAISRHGLHPSTHDFSFKKVDYEFNWENELSSSLRSLVRKFRQEVKQITSLQGNWRQVLDSLRPYSQTIWSNFSEADKKRFFKFIRPYWDMHRHRCPPETSGQLNSMLESGQLKIISGRVIDFTESQDKVTVSVKSRTNQELTEYTVGRVINCTGSELDFCEIEDPFIIDLFTKKLVRSDNMSLGLDADQHGALKDATGKISQVLYTLGPPLKGQLWETTAVPEIRNQAQNLATKILENNSVASSILQLL